MCSATALSHSLHNVKKQAIIPVYIVYHNVGSLYSHLVTESAFGGHLFLE